MLMEDLLKTDPMNLITQWQYDIYGNMVRETNPEGLIHIMNMTVWDVP